MNTWQEFTGSVARDNVRGRQAESAIYCSDRLLLILEKRLSRDVRCHLFNESNAITKTRSNGATIDYYQLCISRFMDGGRWSISDPMAS